MKAKLEAKDSELAELAKAHDASLEELKASHEAEIAEVVAKVEVVAKAFEDGKLSVIEAKEELKSEAKAEDIEEKLEDVEDKFSADVSKDEVVEGSESEYSTWMSMEDPTARQAYFKEHEAKISAQYEQSK